MIKKLIFYIPGWPCCILFTVGPIFSFALFLLLFTSCSAPAYLPQAKGAVLNDRLTRSDSLRMNTLFMDGVRDVMLEHTDSAFHKFSRVLLIQPDNATAHFQLAKLWLKKNNLPEAIASIQRAYTLNPDNKWITQYYADLSALNGNFHLAADIYGELAKKEPAPEEYLVRQAMSLQQAEDFRGALNVLNQLKKYSGEDDETLLMQRQKLFLDLNETDSAIAENKLLIRYYPEKPEYLLLLGDLYFKEGKRMEGLAALKQADRLFPDAPMVQESLIRHYLTEADTAGLSNYLEEIMIGRKGNISDKLDVLSLFANARSKDSLARRFSYQYAQRLASSEPSQQEAVLFYGYLLDADGKKDSAIIQFQKAIALDSTQYRPWQQLLMIFGELMQPDSLVYYGARAAKIFPENPVVYYFQSVGLLLNKNYAEAVTALQSGLQSTRPEDTGLIAQFHASLGDAYQELKNPGAADTNYQLALELQPDNITILNNYSYFLSQQGTRLAEAEQMSAKTLRAKPEEATFLDTYGWILYKLGRYKESKKYLEQALDHMTTEESGVTNEHLGDVEYKLGNSKPAMQYWMKAKTVGGGSDLLDDKIKNGKLND